MGTSHLQEKKRKIRVLDGEERDTSRGPLGVTEVLCGGKARSIGGRLSLGKKRNEIG